MPASKKAKTDDSIPPSSPNVVIDLPTVKEQWSFGRREDRRYPNKKVDLTPGFDRPVLRGGDFVLNKNGFAATMSFFFDYQGQAHGLTVGNLAEIGDPVFCFSDNSALVHPLPENSDEEGSGDEPGESYFMYELGEVVSKSVATDSLVFKITTSAVGIAEFKTLTDKSGLRGQLNLPDPAQDPPFPVVGADLAGFGAQRRGVHGVIRCPSETKNKQYSRVGNISFVLSDGDDKKATDAGDCGTVFLGLRWYPVLFPPLHGKFATLRLVWISACAGNGEPHSTWRDQRI